MSKSKIEWTEFSWNVTTGCTRKSAGCDHCYAVQMTKRLAKIGATKEKYAGLVNEGKDHFNGKIKLHPDVLEEPLRWRKPRMVFVNSMSDLFHPDVPFDFIDKVFAVMALTSHHTYQVLTKRPDRMAEYLGSGIVTSVGHYDRIAIIAQTADLAPAELRENWPLSNVWLMTSIEDQSSADERIPHLLKCPAVVRGLSMEPLLAEVDLTQIPIKTSDPAINLYNCLSGAHFDEEYDDWIDDEKILGMIDWVIVGGESGHNARPMHPDWVRTLRDQCLDADVNFFFKQWGSWCPRRIGQKPAGYLLNDGTFHKKGPVKKKEKFYWWNHRPIMISKPGKETSGRLLDGKEWNQMPGVV